MPKVLKEIPPEWYSLALKQVKYIHRNDEIADKIILEAWNCLKVRSKKQSKRLFPKPRRPARIYLEDMHLFQHLVFICSESVESTQEVLVPASIDESDLIVRYIGFIVRKSLRRNSFYGVTGICRFICRYELDDIRDIHDALFDDLEKVSSDAEYRRIRKIIREMILKRFSKYLRLEENRKGAEKHFQLRENQTDLSLWQLVEESLDSFKPWKIECIPHNFNPKDHNRNAFSHATEHDREMMRLHVLIHQDCFRILTDGLGCPPPNSRLGIPRFFAASSTPNEQLQGPSNS